MDSDLHQSSAIQGQSDSILGLFVGVDGSRERTHNLTNGGRGGNTIMITTRRKIEKNPCLRTLAKMMLNSMIGERITLISPSEE